MSRERDPNPTHSHTAPPPEQQSSGGPPSLFDLNIKSPPHFTPEANLAFFKTEAELKSAPTEEPDSKEHHHHKHEEKKVKKDKKKHKKKTKEKDDKEKGKRKKKRGEKSEEEGGASAESANTSRRASGEAEPVEGTLGLPLATVICDSTVKSPDHSGQKQEVTLLGVGGMTEILKPKELEPLIGNVSIEVGQALLDLDLNFPKRKSFLPVFSKISLKTFRIC